MKESIKYKLLILIRYIGDSFYYPFLSLFLINSGLIEAEIGFILSLTPLIGILLNPLYTRICKNLEITRKVLIITSFLEAIFIGAIGFYNNYYFILISVIFIAIFGSSHYGLMDSLIAVFATKENKNYTSYRIYGSIAYIFGTSIGGILIKLIDFKFVFLIGAILFVIGGLFYIYIKPIYQINEKKNNHLKRVFTNKKFRSFLIVHAFLMAIINSSDNFYSTFLNSRGISSEQYGYIYSYFVLFEVISLLIIRKIKLKRNTYGIYLFCIILTILRMYLNSLEIPVLYSIIFSGLKGIVFSLTLYVCYQYLVDILGDYDSLTGTMIMALCTSIIQIILYNLNGIIISSYGYSRFYLIETIILSVLFILCLFDVLKKKS